MGSLCEGGDRCPPTLVTPPTPLEANTPVAAATVAPPTACENGGPFPGDAANGLGGPGPDMAASNGPQGGGGPGAMLGSYAPPLADLRRNADQAMADMEAVFTSGLFESQSSMAGMGGDPFRAREDTGGGLGLFGSTLRLDPIVELDPLLPESSPVHSTAGSAPAPRTHSGETRWATRFWDTS
mmetsp:Transcript_141916/g.257900  ORF Transcript_141916/g.257900 Transcript_141916/m.257900 type:complete len:183 (-) Transcript_141916:106-654(-)